LYKNICRLVPALAGSLLTPLTYCIMLELGLTAWAGALAGFMILFGKHSSFNSCPTLCWVVN
jgi:dolichyl-phosphate-mannose--protein O-mannosyl transferase